MRILSLISFGPAHNNTFLLSLKMHPSICVHTTILIRFRLSTLKCLKTIELHIVT